MCVELANSLLKWAADLVVGALEVHLLPLLLVELLGQPQRLRVRPLVPAGAASGRLGLGILWRG